MSRERGTLRALLAAACAAWMLIVTALGLLVFAVCAIAGNLV